MGYSIFAATKSSGIFHADDFVIDASDPTWVDITGALPGNNTRQFETDRVNIERTQYCISADDGGLYRRQDGGAWTCILTEAAAQAFVGFAGSIHWVTSDHENEGFIYVIVWLTGYHKGLELVNSKDFGATWNHGFVLGFGGGYISYDGGNVVASGSTLWLSTRSGAGSVGYVRQSRDSGLTFLVNAADLGNAKTWINWAPNLSKDRIMANGSNWIYRVTRDNGGFTNTAKLNHMVLGEGGLWISTGDLDHQRAGVQLSETLHRTANDWAASGSINAGLGGDMQVVTNPPDTEVPVVCGVDKRSGGDYRALFYFPAEDDAGDVNKSGANWNTPPYTDAIPNVLVSDGICYTGLKIYRPGGEINVHAVKGEPVLNVELPEWGDRSVFDVEDFDVRHASDIDAAKLTRHTPLPGNLNNLIYDDGDEWLSGTPAALGLLAHPITLIDASILTLAAGVLAITLDYHIVAAQAGVADDLDTINGGTNDQILVLQADAGDTITIKDGTGNIELNGGADFDLVGDKTIMLFYDGTNWSDIGAGGGGGACPDNGWLCDYWEPAVVAVGFDILYTVDGDIAMVWVA